MQLQFDQNDDQTDPEIVKTLERLAEEWIVTVVGALAKEAKKAPLGNVCALILIFRALLLRLSTGEIEMHPCRRCLSS
jgi:hypothetical protein